MSQQLWQPLAAQLRADSIRCTTAAGSGHPTSGMSAADLMAVLLTSYLKYDFSHPQHPNNDHLIFSKGHACPVLYAMYKAAGAMTDDELLSLRQFGSIWEGHPTPLIPFVDAATGSLGQGLPIGVGVALAGKYIDKLPYKVWVVCGDSEMAEGSIYEALEIAAHYELDNLIAIVDVNKLGQRGETALGHDMDRYRARAEAFGWQAIVIDGHDLAAIDDAYTRALSAKQPVAILAKTDKGHGVSFLSGVPGWHGKSLKPEEAEKALAELGNPSGDLRIDVQKPEDLQPAPLPSATEVTFPDYGPGDSVATRQAYGEALKALGAARADLFAVDAEVSNSTFAETFKKAYPDRFFEMYIAEQIMVSVAQGLDVRHKVAFASTFAAFFSRAYDQIRMAAVSRANLRLVGSHAGVSIGEDGPSQMALEDLAMFRSVFGSAVLYPSDAVSTVHLIRAMAERKGISYLRSTREKTPVLYGPEERFPIGGSKTLRTSDSDKATIIAAGITLHESLKAADELAASGTRVRVIDLYSVKPIDAETIRQAARETGHLIVAEDHWAEGGIGDAVLAALAETPDLKPKFTHLCIREMPRSGKPNELMDAYGISAKHIAEAVR
ncbi:MAG: transketolase [Capsulimonadales bacterium]|nr:transketolase [Capsulimonadales bacterium]